MIKKNLSIPSNVTPDKGRFDTFIKNYTAKGVKSKFPMALAPKTFASMPNERDKIFMGLEHEVVYMDLSDAGQIRLLKEFAKDEKVVNYTTPHRDSGDMEFTTIPATLAYHALAQKEWFFKSKLGESLASVPEETYLTRTGIGIHIHVDIRAFDATSLTKFYTFFAHKPNAKLIHLIAGRKHHAYDGITYHIKVPKTVAGAIKRPKLTIIDKSNLKKGFKEIKAKHGNLGRGCSLNLQGSHEQTLELRLFRGFNQYKDVMRTLEFTDAIVRFSRVAGYKELTSKSFRNYVSARSKKYPNLHTFLTNL